MTVRECALPKRAASAVTVRHGACDFDFDRLRSGPFEGPATGKASGSAGGSLLVVVVGARDPDSMPAPCLLSKARTYLTHNEQGTKSSKFIAIVDPRNETFLGVTASKLLEKACLALVFGAYCVCCNAYLDAHPNRRRSSVALSEDPQRSLLGCVRRSENNLGIGQLV